MQSFTNKYSLYDEDIFGIKFLKLFFVNFVITAVNSKKHEQIFIKF